MTSGQVIPYSNPSALPALYETHGSGDFFGNGIAATTLPFSRDVTLHVQHLLDLSQLDLSQQDSSQFYVINGKSMNALLGDPCPGVTKELVVMWKQRDVDGIFRVSVGENEDLRLSLAVVVHTTSKEGKPSEKEKEKAGGPRLNPNCSSSQELGESCGSAFPSHIHDLVVPFLLPYLPIRDKFYNMSLVCKSFLEVIRRAGATERIDVNDGGEWTGRGYGASSLKYAFYDASVARTQSTILTPETEPKKHHFSLDFINGAIESSTNNLLFLCLADYNDFDFVETLNPILHKFKRLRVLDLSRCVKVRSSATSESPPASLPAHFASFRSALLVSSHFVGAPSLLLISASR